MICAGQPVSFAFRNISINEGLSQSSVVDIATDRMGFIWVATQDGLNRYDGKEFQVFNKNFDDITTAANSTTGKLAVGDDNDLWMITSGGKLERMNLYNQQVINVPILGGYPLPPISCVSVDGNKLWLGTKMNGVIVYNFKTKKLTREDGAAILPDKNDDQINEIFRDNSGRRWILGAQGVTMVHNSNRQTFSFSAAGKTIKSVPCSSIAEDSKNTIWIGSYGNGLFYKDRQDSLLKNFTHFKGSETLPSNLTIYTILADQFNRLWVGTYGQGLYIINFTDSTISHLMADKNNPFSLGYNDVLAIRQDMQGGIWIGTDGGGISYYDRRLNNFILYSSINSHVNVSLEQVRSITTDHQHQVWIGTSNNGLSCIDPATNSIEAIRFPQKKKSLRNYERIVSLFTDSKGDIWVGTQGSGLLIIDAKTKKIKKEFYPDSSANAIPDHTVWDIHPDKGESVWIGTRHAGLTLINKHAGVIRSFTHQPGIENTVAENNIRKIISINDSTLCIGYEKKGIQFFNKYTGQFFSAAELNQFWQQEIIVKSLFYHAPVLWIGTLGKGIITYNLLTKKVFVVAEPHGLPNHTVYGILPDFQGSMWMSTNKGICRLQPPPDITSINRSHFTLFSAEDGLQSNEFNTGAYYQDDRGIMYFGGIKGLNMFNPQGMVVTTKPIRTLIINASVNNDPIQGDTNIAYKKVLRLPHGKNSLSFNFAALDFVSANKLTYYYQLSDYEDGWVNAGNRNYASYTNLPPGKYVFKVKASNNIHSGIDPITTLAIVIEPPFWRTWWFILLSLAVASGVLYALYRYRINQLIELQKVRNRIATDLHDDIGSTLTNISILSELSRKNVQDEEQTKNFLNRISEEVYFSNQALDDIVWSINSSNDTLEQTVARMRRYAAEMFDGGNIAYSLHLDEQFEHYKLNMDQRRDCFLLFKEVINNIYKHAHAKQVSIHIWVERNELHMEIIDDGRGFDTSAESNRNGIKNMHSRIEKRRGSIDIRSGLGKGTSTRIAFPL